MRTISEDHLCSAFLSVDKEAGKQRSQVLRAETLAERSAFDTQRLNHIQKAILSLTSSLWGQKHLVISSGGGVTSSAAHRLFPVW